MRSKKDWLKWFDSLDDDELAKVIERKNDLLKTPVDYDKDILDFIKNNQKETSKKSVLLEKIKDFFDEKPLFGYALSFASLLIILMVSILPFLSLNTLNKTVVTFAENTVSIIDNKNNKINAKSNDAIKEKNRVETEADSSANISIGNDAKISLKENTSILFSKLYKKKESVKSGMYLDNGEAHFTVNKLNSLSVFKVETETIFIEVAGTEFIVTVNNKKDTKVEVIEGRLLISPKFNTEIEIKSIRRHDKGFSKEIEQIINEKFVLEKGQILEVSFNDFNESKNEILKTTSNIAGEISKVKKNRQKIEAIKRRSKARIKKIREARNKIFKLKTKADASMIKNNQNKEKQELKYYTEKIGTLPNLAFTEKSTSLSTDGQFVYITSDSNTTLYCINPSNAKIIWGYKDAQLNDLTGPAVSYKNKIILPTFNKIYIFDKTGKVIESFDVEKGTNYWAEAKISEDKLFIPTSSGVYLYGNTDLNKMDIPAKILGQLYIALTGKKVYFLDSNEQVLKIYNVETNDIEWISDKLENRSFSAPLITGDYLYITDYKSNIYRFDLNTKSPAPEIINIETGVISNLVYHKKNIYFVANNGFFYSIDTEKFDNAVKIITVDKNPNYNIYLTKKLIVHENDLYFSSNTGNLFHYGSDADIREFIEIDSNAKKNPLIAAPIKIKNEIYLIDTEANIYRVTKK